MKTVSSLAVILGLVVCSSAFAGRPVNLKTVEKKGTVSERLPGGGLTVRAPLGTRLSRSMGGSTGTFVPVDGRLNKSGTAKLFDLQSGRYFDSRANKVFQIQPRPAINPIPRPVDTMGRPSTGKTS